MSGSNVIPITKNEMLDIANITMVRFMYYCNRERIPAISSKLSLPESVVMRYLDVEVPRDETLNHVIDYINSKVFDSLTPMEELLGTLFEEIREEDNVNLRSRLISNYVALSKNYALYLDMLKRVNSMNEAGSQINFQLNIIDTHNMLPKG